MILRGYLIQESISWIWYWSMDYTLVCTVHCLLLLEHVVLCRMMWISSEGSRRRIEFQTGKIPKLLGESTPGILIVKIAQGNNVILYNRNSVRSDTSHRPAIIRWRKERINDGYGANLIVLLSAVVCQHRFQDDCSFTVTQSNPVLQSNPQLAISGVLRKSLWPKKEFVLENVATCANTPVALCSLNYHW